jgi:hypothetical protein
LLRDEEEEARPWGRWLHTCIQSWPKLSLFLGY